MRRAYKMRLRPTSTQHVSLQACLDDHRELYNAALQERRDAYERVVKRSPNYWSDKRPKGPVHYKDQSAQLSEIRVVRPEHSRWSFSSQQATLRKLNLAFEAFFRREKAGLEPGYPRFKAEHRFDSVLWPTDGDGCRWHPESGRVYLQGVGQVKVTVHREVEGRVKTVQVKREGRRWFLVLSCDDVPGRPLESTGQVVGVDVGLTSFLTTSDGEHVANPRHARKAAGRLAYAQRVLAHKKRKGTNNRNAARSVVANRHRKVANQRRDFHHKTALALVERFDVIVVEKLAVVNMTRKAKAKPDPAAPGTFLPNGGTAKTGLNRSISDAGWGQFRAILTAKAEEAGRQVVCVNPRNTSRTCPCCGHVAKENRNAAVFECLRCGHTAHADVNAAINILRAGLALLAVPDAA